MLRHPIRTLAILGILIGALAVGDRVAAHAAQRRIATVLQADAHLAHTPKVQIDGFPFLTQAVSGHYGHIEVTADDVFDTAATGPGSITTVSFSGVHLPLSKALGGKVDSVEVDHVTGTADVSFADLAAAAPVPGLALGPVAGHPDELLVSEQSDALGTSTPARVVTTVTASGDAVTLQAQSVELPDGVQASASVVGDLRSHAQFRVALPGLPTGVRLTAVTVGPDGVTASLGADHITLTNTVGVVSDQ